MSRAGRLGVHRVGPADMDTHCRAAADRRTRGYRGRPEHGPVGRCGGTLATPDPRRFVGVQRLITAALRRIVLANIELARRIWAPSRSLSSGMVIVPTQERTDGGLAATGLISSLIVDNQIVDINRERSELQYHAVAVPHGNRQHPEDDINAPVERLLRPIVEEG